MDLTAFRLWLRVRQVPQVLAVLGLITLVGGLWGSELIPLPPIRGFGGVVGLTWFAPVFAACAVALTLASPFEDREAISARRTRARTVALATSLTVLAALLMVLMTQVEGGTHSASQLVAGLMYWTSLALVSARLFGPGLAWALPTGAVVPVVMFGLAATEGTRFVWWALPVSPGSAAAIALGAGMYLLGLGFWSLSPHRIRKLGWRW